MTTPPASHYRGLQGTYPGPVRPLPALPTPHPGPGSPLPSRPLEPLLGGWPDVPFPTGQKATALSCYMVRLVSRHRTPQHVSGVGVCLCRILSPVGVWKSGARAPVSTSTHRACACTPSVLGTHVCCVGALRVTPSSFGAGPSPLSRPGSQRTGDRIKSSGRGSVSTSF